ncbi:hypothetical protein F5Y15DRAFT_377540 [Xylariaceae sp. FL0016]|nr:hypothetical protein F5Y15DRAFT_377540 [Xylariaceae sp. FL0016]
MLTTPAPCLPNHQGYRRLNDVGYSSLLELLREQLFTLHPTSSLVDYNAQFSTTTSFSSSHCSNSTGSAALSCTDRDCQTCHGPAKLVESPRQGSQHVSNRATQSAYRLLARSYSSTVCRDPAEPYPRHRPFRAQLFSVLDSSTTTRRDTYTMHRTSGRNGWDVRGLRTAVLSLSRALTFGLAAAAPITSRDHHDNEPEAEGGALWVLYVVSMVLVLLGGAFAGLTIALMGQDEIYLQVISLDPEEPQRKNAKRVHDLLNKGKHWVLVTLLLSNVIVNETLPVVLDRCFGGGIAAVVGSTVLIVIFGEILPQSICVRYGLQIGGYMSKPVLVLMWLMAIVAWPTAKLLDWLLGADHGTVYKKSGLKTLVTLHKSLGEVDERLNQDEVTIISAVLDLKHKAVDEVMTPMDDVFVMSEDTVLDEKTIDQILDAGYSRIPIHQAGNPTNFVGMLLVKILITYDPEDGKRVKDFSLATLPETRAETSCLDLINFFQEGKSHMVLISEFPGEDHGALGVVTLEDVIEELIGE